PDAAHDAGSQRLGAGFLGGKPLGVGRHHHLLVVGPAGCLGAFDVGEDAVEETVAMAFDDLGNAGDVDQVGADADDHALPALSSCLRPRSIAERMARTVSPSPAKIASPIMK